MKRKMVMKMLCVSIASTMLVSNGALTLAAEGTQTVIYNGQQMTVTLSGDSVVLPDGTIVPASQCQIIAAEPAAETVSQDTTVQETSTPVQQAPETDVPVQQNPEAESPEQEIPVTEEAEEPETETPEAEEPEAETPEAETPEAEEPETEEPETETPETEEPEAETPEAEEPETEAPEPEKPQTSQTQETKETSKPKKEAASALVTATPTIQAGIGFYIEELKALYGIEFSDDFAEMAREIEQEYIQKVEKRKIEKEEDKEIGGFLSLDLGGALQAAWNQTRLDETDTSNWQDVLAVYLLGLKQEGASEYRIDESSKEGLAAVYEAMNPVCETEEGRVLQSLCAEEYLSAAGKDLTEGEKEFLEEYTTSDITILCAAATGMEGFILESFGEEVSAQRAQVVAAAYSLVGKIPYFWGGKSVAIGWDTRWNNPAEVTAAGTDSTGTIQNYGLDCSGFVTWAFVNGYEDSQAASLIGHGTATQWAKSEEITEEEALPGDLVFLQAPSASGINHVGIVVGRNEDDSLIVVHCNAGDNGVTVESAYQAGFRYVRRPLAYDEEETGVQTEGEVALLDR